MDGPKLYYPKQGEVISAAGICGMSRALEPLAQINRPGRMGSALKNGTAFTRAFDPSIYNIPVFNTSESDIPAYGIIRPVTSESETFEESGVFVGDIPNTWSCQHAHLVNGPEIIEAGEVGLATNTFPCPVLFDYTNDVSVTIGSPIGPRASSCKGRLLTGGFRVIAVPTEKDIADSVAWCVRAPMIGTWCKATSDIALDASGTANPWWGAGSKSSVGATITIWATVIGGITANTFIYVVWNEEARWEQIQAICIP